MPFIMHIRVDGGCRHNGRTAAHGAAAAVFYNRNNFATLFAKRLPYFPAPTNQRAELEAVILALERILVKRAGLRRNPRVQVTLFTDSRYAEGCMTKWASKWLGNGWRNAKGEEVANRDLIERALMLQARVQAVGKLRYVWVPREQNVDADRAVNKVLDEM